MENNNQPIIQHTTVADSVYLWIKNAIIQGDLKPGEHIAQERLTKKLGVSRTPVRDAMKRLETEGLLVSKPHCGSIVFQLSKNTLQELYDTRILLEQYCAAITCLKATEQEICSIEDISIRMVSHPYASKEFMLLDRQFHSILCSISGCENTLEILNGLWNKCDSFKSIYYSLEGRANNTLAEHTNILHCLKKRDVEGIKISIADHLKDVVRSIESKLSFEP